MPVFVSAIGGMLLTIVGSLVGRVLASLGLSVLTFYGITQALDFLKNLVLQSLSQLDGSVLQLLGLMKVGTSLSIVFSAMASSMLLNGINSDTFKKWIIN